jgi:probable rRNA maturation factor
MISSDMTKTIDPPTVGDGVSDEESEPPRTRTDISIEDERWMSVAGLADLIPDLVGETLDTARLSSESRSVSIALLSDAEVHALNKAFRGKDASTNVLSFPSAPEPLGLRHQGEPVFLGDVALAFETVAGEAFAQQKPVLHHAAHLVVHGVLHLTGFDHAGDADGERMEAAERVVLERFGIPDPYRDDVFPLIEH